MAKHRVLGSQRLDSSLVDLLRFILAPFHHILHLLMCLAQLIDNHHLSQLHLAEPFLLIAPDVPNGLARFVKDLLRLLFGLLSRLGCHGRHRHVDQERVVVVVLGHETVLRRLDRRGDGFDVLRGCVGC